jgi:hypothetical protein
MEGYRPILLWVSGNSFQASPGRADQPAEPVLEAGTHHPGSEQGDG